MNLNIKISEIAQEKIKEILNNDNPYLRVGVEGGGCSGFKYKIFLEEEKMEDDFLEDINGVKILIDSLSAQYLIGATIDYTKNGLMESISIINPNANTTCGCGMSFS